MANTGPNFAHKPSVDCIVGFGKAAELFHSSNSMIEQRDTDSATTFAAQGFDACRRGLCRLVETQQYAEWCRQDGGWRAARDAGDHTHHDTPAPRLASFQNDAVKQSLAKFAAAVAALIAAPESVKLAVSSLLDEYLAPVAFDDDGSSLVAPLLGLCEGAVAAIKSGAAMRALNRKVARPCQ